jgi:hypothetical protein
MLERDFLIAEPHLEYSCTQRSTAFRTRIFSLRPTAVKLIEYPVQKHQLSSVSVPARENRCATRRKSRPRLAASLVGQVADSQYYRTTIKMKHLAAYLLLQVGGNQSPSAKDIKSLLASVGIEADDDRLKTLISELKGKDVSEV